MSGPNIQSISSLEKEFKKEIRKHSDINDRREEFLSLMFKHFPGLVPGSEAFNAQVDIFKQSNAFKFLLEGVYP